MKALRSPPKLFFDHLIDPLVDEMRRNRELLLVESLDDELAIDQVLERGFPQFDNFLHQLLAGILRAEQTLARFDDFAHLGISDDLVIDDRRDAIDRLRAARRRSGRRHAEAGECEQRHRRITPDEVQSCFSHCHTSGRLRSILPEVKRGNLPPTRIKSPRRLSINLSSRTSTRLTRARAAESLISLSKSKLSTGPGHFPKRSRQSRRRRWSCSLVVISARFR